MITMTRKQRAAVVELLRCAADGLTPESTGAWTDALNGLDVTFDVEFIAARAFMSVLRKPPRRRDCEIGRRAYLEAAQRVEDGEWTE
jgi:hypothetical protein